MPPSQSPPSRSVLERWRAVGKEGVRDSSRLTRREASVSQDTISMKQLGDLISKETEVEEGWGQEAAGGMEGPLSGLQAFYQPLRDIPGQAQPTF